MGGILIKDYDDMVVMYHNIGFELAYLSKFRDEFASYCQKFFPGHSILTGRIAEGWIHAAQSRSKYTLRCRVQTMKKLGLYQRSLGKDSYMPSYDIKPAPSTAPVLFTDVQLKEFFSLADSISSDYRSPNREVIFPVLFRLLYCCGLRVSEACRLLVEHVNLDMGTLEIYHSKGYKDRVVYMSRDLRSLCMGFHRYYDSVLPERRYFFQPSMEKEHYTRIDVANAFGRIRSKMVSCPKNGKLPTSHGLRHLFAVENVKMCIEQGEDFNNWIHYLSQYMGHRKLKDTLYYVHMVSHLFPSYKEKLNQLAEGIDVRYAEE